MLVTKRDGSQEPIDLDKIHKVVEWACEGCENVSVSDIELKAHLQFYNGIPTADIQELLIKSAADLISVNTPDYQYVAAALLNFDLRKQVYGQFQPPKLYDYMVSMVERGLWDADLIDLYSVEDIAYFDSLIDHNNDFKFVFAAMVEWTGKYLVKNRTTKEIFETPQFAYIGIAMALMQHEDTDIRNALVAELYEELVSGRISLPTPIMGGVRTPTRQFSSCTVIDTDDSLDSINATAASIVKYVSQRAGIGVNVGRIRAVGSPIRKGEAEHTGLIPFIKHFQTAVKSCSQGGMRGGAATLTFPVWHYEVENLIVLKNNRGTDDNRARQLDYSVQFNRVMYERLLQDGDITLFSPGDVPDLYAAFYSDTDKFKELYIKYENSSIRKKTVKASQLFSAVLQERAQTGRIYIMNTDHMNDHSSFTDPIRMSNLCQEVSLPTTPLKHSHDDNGEIGLCTLAAFNLGAIESFEQMQKTANILVRALDNLLDYQDYPVKAAEHAKGRRSLGIGVTNFAYWLAKNGLYYSNGSANNAVHRLMEQFQYSLLRASNSLAKERGACAYFHRTKYSKGLLPVDTYKKDVDTICSQSLLLDWDALRKDILEYGVRNSTLSALMPCETSSKITNSTNGIEPPRGLVSTKGSKDGMYKQVVPGVESLHYELLWDIPDNTGYLELVAIMQKFVDQSISANTNYDPTKFPNETVPMQVLIKDLLTTYKLGIKTLYYHNTRDGSDDDLDDGGCASGACKL